MCKCSNRGSIVITNDKMSVIKFLGNCKDECVQLAPHQLVSLPLPFSLLLCCCPPQQNTEIVFVKRYFSIVKLGAKRRAETTKINGPKKRTPRSCEERERERKKGLQFQDVRVSLRRIVAFTRIPIGTRRLFINNNITENAQLICRRNDHLLLRCTDICLILRGDFQ